MMDWHINFVRISKGGCHWIRLGKRSSQLVLLTDFLRSLLQPDPVTFYLCIWNTKRHVGRAVSLHINTTLHCRSQGVYSVAINIWIIFFMHYLLLQCCMSKPVFFVQKKHHSVPHSCYFGKLGFGLLPKFPKLNFHAHGLGVRKEE